MKSLQETYSPEGICFGCGPKNEKGLKIQSFVEGDEIETCFERADKALYRAKGNGRNRVERG